MYSPERLAWALVALGVLLRLAQYAANRSLWVDEASLASNIIDRSLGGLLRPLDYSQGAPIGFLIFDKLAVQVLGNSEYALRLVPLISGVVAVLLFYEVAKRSLGPGAVPIALGFFAISDPLIYYSSEAKQYSTDVAIALFVFSSLQVLHNGNGFSVQRALVLAIVGAIALWFSHPAVFMLAGAGTIAVMVFYRNGDWVAIRQFSIVVLTWLLSLALSYYVSLRHLRSDPYLIEYWAKAFLPFPPSLASLKWLVRTFFNIFEHPVGLGLPGIGELACLVGAIVLWTEKRLTLLTLLLPLCFALAASAFRLYPFGGRLILFVVPFVVLLIGEGAGRVIAATRPHAPMIGMLLVGLLFFHPVLTAGTFLAKPRTIEEIRPVMTYLKMHEENEDVLYVYYYALTAFKYYAGRFGLLADGYVRNTADLERLSGKRRVWILLSHVSNDEKDFFLHYLDTRGRRLDAFERDGAGAYLYNLSRKD